MMVDGDVKKMTKGINWLINFSQFTPTFLLADLRMQLIIANKTFV